MKILIVTSLAGSWPYIPEMLEEFKKRGQHVEVFDINDCRPRGIVSKVAFKVPKLRYRVGLGALRGRLARVSSDFDAVNIHFALPIYRHLVPALKRLGKKLVTSIWGSDFLRAGSSDLHDLGHTLKASDVVTTNNPEILERMVAHYPGISDRMRIVPFGLRSLDVIAELQRSESLEESQRRLGIPSGKLVVTCGYNAIREQRHGMMIEALARLSTTTKSRFFLLIPMTYPDHHAYREEVKAAAEGTGVEYRVLEEKMSAEDIARLRIVSDHVVNVQTTDSLSASIQEHLYAGSSMIVGKWLPYAVLERMGIHLHRVEDAEAIAGVLENAARAGKARRGRPEYADKIYDYSSWSSNAPRWLELYGHYQSGEIGGRWKLPGILDAVDSDLAEGFGEVRSR
jgi:glycosyl transferase family 4